MKLKYEEEIASYQPCPGKRQTIPENKVGYRFSHTPIEADRNFLPIAILDFSRMAGKNKKFCCSAYGLSMFESVAQLQTRLHEIEEFNSYARKTLGDYWVAMEINSQSGLITPPDKKGHFDFHEDISFKGQDSIRDSGVLE